MESPFIERLSVFLVDNEIHLLFSALIIAFVVFALIEGVRPRKPQTRDKLKHRWSANFGLMLLNQLNTTWVTAYVAVIVAWWSGGQDWGLVPYLGIGFWTATLLTVLTFEFISYVMHRLLHAVPVLWRIHAVHHCDPEIDFTTTFRNHPLELVVTAPVTVPLVLLLGFPAASIVLYQILRTSIIVFAHSNIRLPQHVDAVLRRVITTPDYHRIHHSSDRFYTDSNFCPAFPLYDYLFGTAKKVPYATLPSMRLGLDYLSSRRQTGFIGLLLIPFIWKRQVSAPAVESSRI